MTVPTSDPTDTATDLRVRRAAGHDLPTMVETLTEAFLDDPFVTWWMPDPDRRRHLLPAFFEIIVDVHHAYDELYVTDPVAAAAVWVPPGCQPTEEQAEQVVGVVVDAIEETAERLLCALQLMGEHHPEDPHAYLFFLATRRQWQSRGLGSALLREVLDRCDREGAPAYLEATSPANLRLYLRHGFEVTAEIPLPDGPSLWPMWREPAMRRA
jgi:Acetyltransferases